MSAAEARELSDILDRVEAWSPSMRIALARRILQSLEGPSASKPAPAKSLEGIIGLLKTDAPPPSDEECRAILEEELIKKHLR